MPDSWTKIIKPSGDTWNKTTKPSDEIVTTVTTIPHPKGRFMGILGLTYPGTSVTTTTTVLRTWTKTQKPTDASWGKVGKPIS